MDLRRQAAQAMHDSEFVSHAAAKAAVATWSEAQCQEYIAAHPPGAVWQPERRPEPAEEAAAPENAASEGTPPAEAAEAPARAKRRGVAKGG